MIVHFVIKYGIGDQLAMIFNKKYMNTDIRFKIIYH